ncbi:MAG: TIGR02757 family protein [Kiritimatiellae bacterium]|nr:TIGR02757 family protein [Kiritimatiellia bacterium]
MKVGADVRRMLRRYAAQYETASFLDGDPSWFMHQVEGDANREAVAFVASCLSFGSRSLFMPRVQGLLDRAGSDMDSWVREGRFAADLPRGCTRCFYRFFTCGCMHDFLAAYRDLLVEHGTLGAYVRREAAGDGFRAVEAICRRFAPCGAGVVPKDARSACKRVCMFLRWMVRSGSPVDLGLWADFIDRRTLVMPLDTHVVRQSVRLGLLKGSSASMASARRLTAALAEVFPDDPLRGDFALFGYGVNHAKTASRHGMKGDRRL